MGLNQLHSFFILTKTEILKYIIKVKCMVDKSLLFKAMMDDAFQDLIAND
jgi:hypothetical protein